MTPEIYDDSPPCGEKHPYSCYIQANSITTAQPMSHVPWQTTIYAAAGNQPIKGCLQGVIGSKLAYRWQYYAMSNNTG